MAVICTKTKSLFEIFIFYIYFSIFFNLFIFLSKIVFNDKYKKIFKIINKETSFRLATFASIFIVTVSISCIPIISKEQLGDWSSNTI